MFVDTLENLELVLEIGYVVVCIEDYALGFREWSDKSQGMNVEEETDSCQK